MALQPAQTAVLVTGLAAAVYFDTRTRRIPNVLTLSMAAAGMLLFSFEGGLGGMWRSIQGILVAFALFVIPFFMRGLGGGDLKLAMAVGAVTGPEFAFTALFYGIVAGGAIAAWILIRTGRLTSFLKRLLAAALHVHWPLRAATLGEAPVSLEYPPGSDEGAAARQESFPYAIAVAAGVLLASWMVSGGA